MNTQSHPLNQLVRSFCELETKATPEESFAIFFKRLFNAAYRDVLSRTKLDFSATGSVNLTSEDALVHFFKRVFNATSEFSTSTSSIIHSSSSCDSILLFLILLISIPVIVITFFLIHRYIFQLDNGRSSNNRNEREYHGLRQFNRNSVHVQDNVCSTST